MNDGITILTIDSYPDTLKQLNSLPKKFYMRGTLPDQKGRKLLCVVGSRKDSDYGRDACRKIIMGLNGYPISIVSGLAIGIDSYSHTVALEAGLNCIGFPGSSLDWDRIYPASSTPLAKRIIANGGSLLSEYSSADTYAEWAFARRNRYMAGISHATLIIEARKRSGSLMTAKYAEEYSRDVLAVPGSIFSDLTHGPHMLLGGCANPATCSEDVLRVLGFDVKSRSIMETGAFRALDPVSKQLVREVACGEITIDILAEKLKIGIGDLNEKISYLELEGFIKTNGDLLHLA